MTQLDRRSLTFAMSLSVLAGFVDAIGFLSLDGYFVSFMSGNSTRLGVGLGQLSIQLIAMPLMIIALFVTGVVLGSLIARQAGNARRLRIFLLVGGLLALAAAFADVHLKVLAMCAMALAMGAENTILRRDGVSVGLTYMTGNLVKLGHSLADMFRGEKTKEWIHFLLLWFALFGGAGLGALSHRFIAMNGLWLAAAYSLAFAMRFRSPIAEAE